jgi:hypothetical protein
MVGDASKLVMAGQNGSSVEFDQEKNRKINA